MSKQENLLEIKDRLKIKVAEISSVSESGKILITSNDGKKIEIRSTYSKKEFGLPIGRMIRKQSDHSCIGIVIGVGKGCCSNPEQENLYFLFKGDTGISHYCGKRRPEFKEEFELLELI